MTAFLLGIAVLSTFSIALTARPISAENLICDLLSQDCTNPPTPVLSSPADATFLASNGFDFSWQAVEDLSGVSYKVCVASINTFIPESCSDAITETSYPANSLVPNENQTKYWRVLAIDGAGNESDWTETRSFTVDVDNPTASLNASPTLIGGNTPITTLTGNVSDSNLTHYDLVITDSSAAVVDTVSIDTTETSVDVSHQWDASGKATGNYTATLTATDKAGRTTSIAINIEVDNSGPELSIAGGKIIKSGSITPTVTTTDPHEVVTYKWVADKTNSGPITFDDSVKEPEFTPTIQGSYVFTLTVTDGLGNTSSGDFEFGYAAELEPLPLPTSSEETTPPNLPAAVSPTSNLTRDPREDIEPSEDQTSQVLGTTSGGTGNPSGTTTTAALTSTESGWKIVGILWYWWVAAIVGVLAAWAALKRFLSGRTNQNP